MRVLALFLVLCSLPASALRRRDAAPPDPTASPEALLAGLVDDEFLVTNDLVDEAAARHGFVEPGKVLGELAKAKATWPAVVARIAKDEKLAKDAAEPLARALVRWKAFQLEFRRAPHELIAADFEAAIVASKGAIVPFACAAHYFVYDGGARGGPQWIAMAGRLAPKLPVVAKRLVELAHEEPWPDESLLLAIELQPDLLVEAAGKYERGLAALLPTYDAALAKVPAKDVKTAGNIANSKLSVLLDAGLAADAVAAFEALPEPLRETVLAHPGPVQKRFGRLETWEGGRSVVADLAAAYFLTGDEETASTLLHRVSGRTDWPTNSRERRETALLEAALRPERDPFEVLVRVPAQSALWEQVALRAAHEYPEFADRELRHLTEERIRRRDEPDDEAPVPKRAQAARAPFDAKVRALREGYAKQLEEQRKAEAAVTDPMSATIEKLLAAPALQPCRERPIAETPEKSAWKALHAEPPNGFYRITAASRGKDAVAILASQRLDPTGEVSRGAYWFARSLDGGTTWSKPVYLGLREMRPYRINPDAVPRFEGETLVLPAEIHEIDEERVVFPPISLPTKRESGPVELACALADLGRDRDGDGLADLVEERLVTDPANADTDGDGLKDGEDPMPQVPAKGSPNLRGIVLFRALTERAPQPGIIVGPFASAVGPSQLADDVETEFLVTDRTELAGLGGKKRIVVLTPSEAEKARTKFGAFYPRRAPFVATNHAGTLAYVVWSTGWAGGEYLLRKKGDDWFAEVLSSWIT